MIIDYQVARSGPRGHSRRAEMSLGEVIEVNVESIITRVSYVVVNSACRNQHEGINNNTRR